MARSPSRIPSWLLGVPVFVKVMGIALAIAALLGAGMLWQIHRAWHAHLIRDLDQRGQKLATQVSAHLTELARAGLAADIPAELRHSIEESVDAAYLVLRDSNGVVLASARGNEPVGSTNQIRELTSPLGLGTHRLAAGMSTARLDREVGWLTRRLAVTTAVIALLGMTGAWWLSRVFAHPIEELAALTRAVKAGRYQSRAPVHAADEVGELAVAFNEMAAAIAEKEAARQQLLRKVIRAGEEERKRIARDLHDHTGQALTSQIAGLSAMENQAANPAARQRLVDLRKQAENTLSEVHDLSVALRPSVLDDVGLMAALERHCRLFARRTGIEVACTNAGLDGDRLPAEVELTLYRTVQEALTNAVRHGKANRVSVHVERLGVEVRATVQDDGSGFDARDWEERHEDGNHLGLLGIEERVTLLGGKFRLESAPGKGVIVHAEIPIHSQP